MKSHIIGEKEKNTFVKKNLSAICFLNMKTDMGLSQVFKKY